LSAYLFADDVLFAQRLFRSADCYAGAFTSVWDTATDSAETSFVQRCDAIATELTSFDQRSERCIRTLHPRAQEAARRFLTTARAGGMDVRIISGTRTYAEQNQLYRRGRYGTPPPVVTNARGGQSNHNFGIAWDVGVFVNGAYSQDEQQYEKVAANALSAGLEWGGNWATFKDRPHYQLALTLSLTEIRARFEAGQAFV